MALRGGHHPKTWYIICRIVNCLIAPPRNILTYLHYYQTVVRPVLDYACPVWHSSLSKQQTKLLEEVQRRALRNADYSRQHPYSEACCMLGIQSLADRRSEMCRTLFKQIVNNEFHSLHYLLPAKHDTQLIRRLRSTTVYQTFRARTILKIRSYPTACLITSDSRNILFYFLLCVCVCLCICAIVLIQLLAAETQ